jgi:hypothetical protein
MKSLDHADRAAVGSWISQYASRDFFNVGFVAGFEIVTGHKAVRSATAQIPRAQ